MRLQGHAPHRNQKQKLRRKDEREFKDTQMKIALQWPVGLQKKPSWSKWVYLATNNYFKELLINKFEWSENYFNNNKQLLIIIDN